MIKNHLNAIWFRQKKKNYSQCRRSWGCRRCSHIP